jgi:hypothetical protein
MTTEEQLAEIIKLLVEISKKLDQTNSWLSAIEIHSIG